ncbi:MAG: hypothetical protein WCT46_06285 [Candidatus Gracilibacteria bacterium]|jgi:hypothetical protein
MQKKSSAWFVFAFISVILFFATSFLNATMKSVFIDSENTLKFTVVTYALKILGIASGFGGIMGAFMGVKYSEKNDTSK